MSIVFSAITPHSPFLIPNVGKENRDKLKQTIDSYQKLEEELSSHQVDTIVVISSQGISNKDTFTFNIAPEFDCRFEEFADLTTKMQITGDTELAMKIRGVLESKTKLQVISEEVLDFGSAIPFYLLTKNMPNTKIIPIYTSGLSLEEHFEFGKLLKHELQLDEKKIAVIASADLSHKLSKDSPAGYSEKAKKFDKKIIDLVIKDDANGVINIDQKLLTEVNESGSKSITMMLGIMNDIKKTAKLMSYEAPFGVGYAVIKYDI